MLKDLCQKMYFLKKLQKVTLAQFQGDINSYCDLKIIIKKIWKEQCYLDKWHKAYVIHISGPEKVTKTFLICLFQLKCKVVWFF